MLVHCYWHALYDWLTGGSDRLYEDGLGDRVWTISDGKTGKCSYIKPEFVRRSRG